MPLTRTPLTGNQIVAMANVSLQRTYTIQVPGPVPQTSIVNEINVLGLPSLMYWIRLNSAVGNVLFTPLFAVQNTNVGTVVSPNWLPFTNGVVLVPGNIFVFTIRAAVANAAAEFIIPNVPPGNNISVDVVITAGG
jgi:hypothetical protein